MTGTVSKMTRVNLIIHSCYVDKLKGRKEIALPVFFSTHNSISKFCLVDQSASFVVMVRKVTMNLMQPQKSCRSCVYTHSKYYKYV